MNDTLKSINELFKELYAERVKELIPKGVMKINNPKNNLTKEQEVCYHKFVLVGRSPVLDEEWWNCKFCSAAKEDCTETEDQPIWKTSDGKFYF